MWDKEWMPWDDGGQWVVWLIALVIATFFIHNVQRAYKESGRQ